MKINKILIIIILLILITFCLSTKVQAFGDLVNNSIRAGQSFTNQGNTSVLNYTRLGTAFQTIYGFTYALAIIVAIIYGFYVAARVIVSSSAEEKVDTRRMILHYLRNVVIIALIPMLFKILYEIFT